ncbi:MAG TPA: cobalamin-dependent protein [Gemmatimonadaceae bacterium]|nr:cobalamin-dependent protein [Gemmatimonadaceae bacterium]
MTTASLTSALEEQSERIATLVTERQFAADRTLEARFGERGRQKCTEDARRHLEYLSSAASAESDTLFADYVAWAKILLARLGLSDDDLAKNLVLMRDAVRETLGAPHGDAAARIVDSALGRLGEMPSVSESFLSDRQPHAELARRYLDLLLSGDRQTASTLILDAVRDGVSVRDIYLHVFQRTQHEIGRRWQMNEISVAQEHFCTAATQLIMSQLYPRIFATPRVGRRLVAACVGGDLHEIGVRMVADFFEMAGWDTYYLGANTPIEGIVESVSQRRAHVVAISATMSYHVPAVGDVVRSVRERSTGWAPRIVVGGYPFRVDPDLWRSVGADGYAPDASEAVALAERLVRDNA